MSDLSQPFGNAVFRRVRLVPTGWWSDPGIADDGPGKRVRKIYRALVIGTAILHRPAGSRGRWTVDLADGVDCLPHSPRRAAGLRRILNLHTSLGKTVRIGAALVTPSDAAGDRIHPATRHSRPAQSCQDAAVDIYGYSLMYQLPGMEGVAAVDPHEFFDDMPAWFDSPLELLDRAEFLAARGIPHRPLAIVTQRQDFEPAESDSSPRNRYCRQTAFRQPCRIDAFL